MNVLKSRVEDFEEVLQVVNGSRLLVLETNIVMTANKVYYYELIAQNNEDIRMYCNDKKVTFLDSLGYYVSEDP